MNPTFDKKEAAAALKKFFADGDVFEIRALDAVTATYNRPHTVSGYFDFAHIDTAVDLIASEIRNARGIYFTPNPVEPALLARAANRFRDMGNRDTGTADKDIPRRRWFLVDCDAVRPSGISSTDAEHTAAKEKAAEIKAGFSSIGFPDPVEIDSGNGAQLMYRVDMPGGVDDTVIKAILKKLQACNSPEVDVDESVCNTSRIWRLPGSVNRKGDPIPDRPHRTAKIIHFPEPLQKVPMEKMLDAADLQKEKDFDPEDYVDRISGSGAKISNIDFSKIDDSVSATEPFDLAVWINRFCPDAEGPGDWNGGKKWIFPVCPFNPDHQNRSAVLTEQASGAIGFTCHHNGCKGNDWQKLRELREPGFSERKKERQAVRIPLPPVHFSVDVEDEEPEEVTPDPAPWRDITSKDIQESIEGTMLGEMTKLYASVTVPPLPLEAALLKAIVTAGCALSGPGTPSVKNGLLPPTGAQRARLRINTAGGQVCNIYALLAANSASGKDIGNILDSVTTAKNWNIGTSGSAEGIAEALKQIPNGLISISEFMNWLDEKHWQHKATSFLTEAFSKGYFRHNFSSRSGKNGQSSSDYCYPNIIANIQPEVFENIVRSQDIASGFMGRFLYAKMPEFFGDPAKIDISDILRQFATIIVLFEKKHGIVEVPDDYSKSLSKMFKMYSPEKLHPIWRRLVNEYLPRLAVMLSIDFRIRTQGDTVILEKEHWQKAEKMVQWFFAHAEKMLMMVEDQTNQARNQEKIMRRIVSIIRRYDTGSGVNARRISFNASHTGTPAEQRRQILVEMEERGYITSTVPGCGRGAKFFLKNVPPGW